MRRARALAASLVLLSVAAVALGAAPAVAEEPAVRESAFTVSGTPEADGRPVDLDVTLLSTDPSTPRPAVLLAHGFGGTKQDSLATGRTLARRGYTVIAYTARGFGASGGSIHLDDPAYEGADAQRLVDFAAGRREVQRTGDDPVIGVAGASYGGAAALLAASLDRRVDAVAAAFTWHSLTDSLFPQYRTDGAAASLADVSPVGGAGVFKQRWAALLFSSAAGGPGSAAGGPGPAADGGGSAGLCGRFTPELCAGYLEAAQTGRPTRALTALLDRADLGRLLPSVTAPTLLLQGEDDTLFGLDQADANLRSLPRDTPARLSWVTGGHDGDAGPDRLVDDLGSWFDRYLRHDLDHPRRGEDDSAAAPGFSVVVPQTSLVGEGGTRDPETRVAAAYPGLAGGPPPTLGLPLSGPAQPVISPPGGVPTALTNLPGTGGALAQASALGGYALAVLPGQAATFSSEPLAAPLDQLGSARVDLEVTSDGTEATLFAALWDLGPDVSRDVGGRSVTAPSTAVLPHLAVAPVRVTGLNPGRPAVIRVALPAIAHQVPVGHRVQLVVSSTDQAYATPSAPAVYRVALAGDRALAVPVLTGAEVQGGGLQVPLPLVVTVGALAVAALVALLVLRRRRRPGAERLELARLPLAVTDLVKTYGDGLRAVDGVSFSAEPGQIVGLLGPNGAGKTTVMRMLVGLIRPDSGTVHVHGRLVQPGSEVLDSVGALIEGPGFLPHLSGLANLTAYWQATGRPAEEAHLDEALAIAGLGEAVHRRVRGYSQGMRQRLGIAQAMLGLPELLLLDEPTNGLDPPQIKAMRTVLADYAAAGRTVVVSSHLLAEVEQTCSHVVVMDRGKVVLTGSVAELTAGGGATLIGLADAGRTEEARRVLRSAGLTAEPENGLLRVTGALPRAEIVARLVGAGLGVESVDGHRQLEEVFMTLVGHSDEAAAAGSRP